MNELLSVICIIRWVQLSSSIKMCRTVDTFYETTVHNILLCVIDKGGHLNLF